MGQKSNPNSFQLQSKTIFFSGNAFNTVEYSTLFKEHYSISLNLTTFFEKNNCLVKDCFFILNNEKSFLTIFINFLVLKRVQNAKYSLKSSNNSNIGLKTIVQKLFNILSKFGYKTSKRFVLQNLNKVALKHQKTIFSDEHLRIKKELNFFRKETYFDIGLFLFCLMNTTKNSSFLFAKFVGRFFKTFHRTKKINKFLLFLAKFVENVANTRLKGRHIKGLKIQIKGRFKGVPRSKIRVFEKGSIPLQTITNKINYSLFHVNTSYGVFGIKVWLFE